MWLTILLLRDHDGAGVLVDGTCGHVVDYPAETAMRLVEHGHAIPLNDAPFEFNNPYPRRKVSLRGREATA